MKQTTKTTHTPKKHTRPFHPPTIIHTPANTTQESLNALLPFSLQPNHSSNTHHTTNLSPALLNKIQSAQLALITGPSGSGKSTLLRALQHKLQSTITPANLPHINHSLPIVNLFNQPLNQTLSLLSSVGLAEPKLWALPEHALSTGEQARLQIARLISTAKPTDTIILDELATPLDRLTARSLCASLNTLIKRSPSLKIIAAAAHEDLPTFLDADLLVNAANRSILPSQYTKESIAYEPAALKDYHALKHHHYIPSDPVSIVQITRAMRHCPVTGNQTPPILAGILIVAYPTLNASHRDRAWPNRYTTSNKSQNAKRVNTELRRIARVIVAPHSRALGIATTLVRNYLNNPLTPATEALAAMGTISPFFKNAGMTEYPIPHSPTDHRLLDTLHHLNQTPHNLLQSPLYSFASPGLPGEVAAKQTEGAFSSPTPIHPLLQRELKTWARAKNLDPNDPNLPAHAAFKLLTKPCAYTHVQQEYQA